MFYTMIPCIMMRARTIVSGFQKQILFCIISISALIIIIYYYYFTPDNRAGRPQEFEQKEQFVIIMHEFEIFQKNSIRYKVCTSWYQYAAVQRLLLQGCIQFVVFCDFLFLYIYNNKIIPHIKIEQSKIFKKQQQLTIKKQHKYYKEYNNSQRFRTFVINKS